MKPTLLFGLHTAIPRRIVASLLLTVCFTAAAYADFSTGFEASSGYTAGSTVVGVDDSGLPGTASWSQPFGTSANATITNSGALVGSQSLSLYNPGSSQSAQLNLTGAVDFSQAFTVSMVFNPLVANGTSAFNFQLGSSSYGAQYPYWLRGFIGSGAANTGTGIYLYQGTATSSATVSATRIGTITISQNVTLSMTIDPTAHLYTNITLNGTDVTSTIPYAVPYLDSSTVSSYLTFVTGSGSSGSLTYVDSFAISNVPEPGTAALAMVGAGMMLLMGQRRRLNSRRSAACPQAPPR